MLSFMQGPTGALALIYLGISLLTRFALLMASGSEQVPISLWPELFLRGAWFDLLVLAWLIAPLLLFHALGRTRENLATWRKSLRLLLFWVATCFLLFGALAEWTFWEEFSTRFNFIAVDYLIYTHEVIGNIMESYPVGWLLSAIAILGALVTWRLRHGVLAPRVAPTPWRHRLASATLAVSLPWAAWQLGDIDQMQFSQNAYANELAGNGMMTFLAAARRNELDYARFYRTIPENEALQHLAEAGWGRTAAQPGHQVAGSGVAHPPPGWSRAPRNVVLISVESLSASFLGVLGGKEGLTPNLDRLASEGLLFTRLYATGTRTVRGLEALSLGTPPIPGQAIVRRPGNEKLSTLGEIMRAQGYETFFVYGGYGYFDNMNAYFAGNDYQVIDRTDFPKESVGFENVWGVADEYLFNNAMTVMDKSHGAGKPFLAHIMTTSNHRPYTYPTGRIDIPPPGGREGGVKYTDYAIGQFIEQAKEKPWFKDTLFVIVADHCASVAGKTKLPVEGYHIPLILYAPGIVPSGNNNRLASQIDIPPTLLAVLGLKGGERFFGKSVFDQDGDLPRAFISNYQELGYLKQGHLVVLSPKGKVQTFRVDEENRTRPAENIPSLTQEAIAWYQTADQSFKRGTLKFR